MTSDTGDKQLNDAIEAAKDWQPPTLLDLCSKKGEKRLFAFEANPLNAHPFYFEKYFDPNDADAATLRRRFVSRVISYFGTSPIKTVSAPRYFQLEVIRSVRAYVMVQQRAPDDVVVRATFYQEQPEVVGADDIKADMKKLGSMVFSVNSAGTAITNIFPNFDTQLQPFPATALPELTALSNMVNAVEIRRPTVPTVDIVDLTGSTRTDAIVGFTIHPGHYEELRALAEFAPEMLSRRVAVAQVPGTLDDNTMELKAYFLMVEGDRDVKEVVRTNSYVLMGLHTLALDIVQYLTVDGKLHVSEGSKQPLDQRTGVSEEERSSLTNFELGLHVRNSGASPLFRSPPATDTVASGPTPGGRKAPMSAGVGVNREVHATARWQQSGSKKGDLPATVIDRKPSDFIFQEPLEGENERSADNS